MSDRAPPLADLGVTDEAICATFAAIPGLVREALGRDNQEATMSDREPTRAERDADEAVREANLRQLRESAHLAADLARTFYAAVRDGGIDEDTALALSVTYLTETLRVIYRQSAG